MCEARGWCNRPPVASALCVLNKNERVPADILVPGLSQNGSQDLAIDVWYLFQTQSDDATGGQMHHPHASHTQSPQNKAARHPKQ